MKLRYHLAIVVALCLTFGALGLSKRQSYTNVTADPSFLKDFYVAEIPSALAIEDCQKLKEDLPTAPIILKVSTVNPLEILFGGRQQKVSIEHVYSGDGLENGQEIYITADHWKVYPSDKTIDAGFVNVMKEGADYLVFLSDCIGTSKDYTDVYRLQSGRYINPVFRYSSGENIIFPVSEESTYVPYTEVSNNEFFSVESDGMQAFLSLKQEMIELFP